MAAGEMDGQVDGARMGSGETGHAILCPFDHENCEAESCDCWCHRPEPLPRGGECRNYRGNEKVVYATEADAQVVVDRLQAIPLSASRRRPYVAYRCRHGHEGWHVGRTPREVKHPRHSGRSST